MARKPCEHCGVVPAVRRVQTILIGTKPVDLAFCDCDYARCQTKGCGQPLRAGKHSCVGRGA